MMPGFVTGEATYRTRRRQLVVAAATGAIALALAVGPLFGVRDRLAYTNNVPARALATAIDPGSRLCQSDAYLPADASGVRLFLLTYGHPGSQLKLTLRTHRRTIRSSLDDGYSDQTYVTFPIARPGQPTKSTLCVQNTGARRVAFGGLGRDSPVGSPLSVDGRRVPAVIAIDITAPRSSLFGLAPTIFERATVWAPPWVGRWTYYALFALALVIVIASVNLVLVQRDSRSLRNGRRRRLGPPRVAWAIALVAVGNAAIWAIIVPPWQAPDEIEHFAYVQYLAETGKFSVDPGATRDYSEEHQYAMENGLTNAFRNSPKGRPPWRQVDRRAWEERELRTHPSRSDGGGAPHLNYTPEYYAVASLGYWAFNWGDIFDRLLGARLVSALLSGLTAVWVWLFARELFRRDGFLPSTAALSVALLPQFGFVSGVVNNDNLLIMFASLELYLLARFLSRSPTITLAMVIGVVLALGYLAKPSMAAFGPVVAGVLAWPAVRNRDVRLLRGAAVALAGFAAVALAWTGIAALSDRSVSTVTTAGTRAFSLHDYLSYVYHFYLPSLPGSVDRWFGAQSPAYTVWMHSFFATFGWTDTFFPERVYKALTGICVGIAVLIGIAAWRERRAARRALPVLVTGGASVVSLLLLLHLIFYLTYAGFPGEQGRYLLPLAPIFGAAVAASTLALGRRNAPLLAAFYVTALGCFTLFSYALTLTRYYA